MNFSLSKISNKQILLGLGGLLTIIYVIKRVRSYKYIKLRKDFGITKHVGNVSTDFKVNVIQNPNQK